MPLLFSLPSSALFKPQLHLAYQLPTGVGLWRLAGEQAAELTFFRQWMDKLQVPPSINCVYLLLSVSRRAAALAQQHRCTIELQQVGPGTCVVSVDGAATDAVLETVKQELLVANTTWSYRKMAVDSVVGMVDPHTRLPHAAVTSQLTKVSKFYGVDVFMTAAEVDFTPSRPMPSQDLYLYIVGPADAVTLAETRVKVLLSTLRDSTVAAAVPLPLLVLPCLGGSQMQVFNQLARTTGVLILLPDILPTNEHAVLAPVARQMHKVFLVGELNAQVVMARRALVLLAQPLTTGSPLQLVCQDVQVLRTKHQLLMINNQLEIVEIMVQHGVFVQLESGETDASSTATIRIQGPSKAAVAAALADLTVLIRQVYMCQVYVPLEHAARAAAETRSLLESMAAQLPAGASKHMSVRTVPVGTDQHHAVVEVAGNVASVKGFVQLWCRLLLVPQSAGAQVVFELEVAALDREFITGKKNGKLHRVMQRTPAIVKFRPATLLTFVVEIIGQGSQWARVATALQMVEEELPFEHTLNIPETFHRLVIGTGGQVIQQIMRRHNVFIKFSNLGTDTANGLACPWVFQRQPNVTVRCPVKYAGQVAAVERDLAALVAQNKQDLHTTIQVPMYRAAFRLLGRHPPGEAHSLADAVLGVEKRTASHMDMWSVEPAGPQAAVLVSGAGRAAEAAAAHLRSWMPHCVEIQVAFSHRFGREFAPGLALYLRFLHKVVYPLQCVFDLEVEVTASNEAVDKENGPMAFDPLGVMAVKSSDLPVGGCHVVRMFYFPTHTPRIDDAVEVMVAYLRDHNYLIADKRVTEPAALGQVLPVRALTRKNGGLRQNQNRKGSKGPAEAFTVPSLEEFSGR